MAVTQYVRSKASCSVSKSGSAGASVRGHVCACGRRRRHAIRRFHKQLGGRCRAEATHHQQPQAPWITSAWARNRLRRNSVRRFWARTSVACGCSQRTGSSNVCMRLKKAQEMATLRSTTEVLKDVSQVASCQLPEADDVKAGEVQGDRSIAMPTHFLSLWETRQKKRATKKMSSLFFWSNY